MDANPGTSDGRDRLVDWVPWVPWVTFGQEPTWMHRVRGHDRHRWDIVRTHQNLLHWYIHSLNGDHRPRYLLST